MSWFLALLWVPLSRQTLVAPEPPHAHARPGGYAPLAGVGWLGSHQCLPAEWHSQQWQDKGVIVANIIHEFGLAAAGQRPGAAHRTHATPSTRPEPVPQPGRHGTRAAADYPAALISCGLRHGHPALCSSQRLLSSADEQQPATCSSQPEMQGPGPRATHCSCRELQRRPLSVGMPTSASSRALLCPRHATPPKRRRHRQSGRQQLDPTALLSAASASRHRGWPSWGAGDDLSLPSAPALRTRLLPASAPSTSAPSTHPPDVDPEGCHPKEVPLLCAEAGQLALRLRVACQREQLLHHQRLRARPVWQGSGGWVSRGAARAAPGRRRGRACLLPRTPRAAPTTPPACSTHHSTPSTHLDPQHHEHQRHMPRPDDGKKRGDQHQGGHRPHPEGAVAGLRRLHTGKTVGDSRGWRVSGGLPASAQLGAARCAQACCPLHAAAHGCSPAPGRQAELQWRRTPLPPPGRRCRRRSGRAAAGCWSCAAASGARPWGWAWRPLLLSQPSCWGRPERAPNLS